jgi:hypothetical protein
MKKRGVRKAKSSSRHRNARKKAKPKTKRKKRPVSEVAAAQRILTKEEKAIEKGIQFAFGPKELHITLFVLSLIVLAFLFSSISLVFYAVLSIAALLFANFMHHHEHRPHDILNILGLFFLPLLFTLLAFQDTLVWLLLAVYTVSVISTIVVYYYHKKVHTPLKIMWQVTYSRIVAITLALIVACLLPSFVFPDSFLSIFEMVFIFVLPVAFVFFFFSKFFYVYFFDRKHIRADILKSLRYTVTYTLVFIILLMCIYTIFAAALHSQRADVYGSDLDFALVGIAGLEKNIEQSPQKDLTVSRDLLTYTTRLKDEISAEKGAVVERKLSFADIMDDSYFEELSDDVYSSVRFVTLQSDIADLKSSIAEKHADFSEREDDGIAFDGSQSVEQYASELMLNVEENFNPLSRDPGVQELVEKLDDPSEQFSSVDRQGFLYWFSEEADLAPIFHSDSVFGRQMSIVIRQMKPFRSLADLTVKIIVFTHKEAASSSAVEYLYDTREADADPMSAAIRYSIIADSIESADERVSEAGKIGFRVDWCG